MSINREQPLIKALLERRSPPAKWSGRFALLIYPSFIVLIGLWLADFLPAKLYVFGLAFLFGLAPFVMILALWGMMNVWNTGYQGGKRASLALLLMLPLVIILFFAGREISQGIITHDVWTGKGVKPNYISLAEIRRKDVYRAPLPQSLKESGFIKPPPLPPRPVILDISMAEAVSFATLSATSDMGWRIIDEIPIQFDETFRFEATDYTFPLFFNDDIIVVFEDMEDGVHINARSSSRVGQHDFGANDKRIHDYFIAIEARAADSIYNPEDFTAGESKNTARDPDAIPLPQRKPE